MLDLTKDFFDVFNIEKSFSIDKNHIEKEYFLLQNKYHPDRFVNASEEEKFEAAQSSIFINKAYNTLKDDLKRSEYILKIQSIMVNTESSDSIKPCPILLMEVMEDRDQLSELKNFDDIQDFENRINSKKEKCLNELDNEFNNENYNDAASLTIRLQFLTKILEEIRLKKLKELQ